MIQLTRADLIGLYSYVLRLCHCMKCRAKKTNLEIGIEIGIDKLNTLNLAYFLMDSAIAIKTKNFHVNHPKFNSYVERDNRP